MSSTNVTIPAESMVIAVAAPALPIVPSFLIFISSTNVTIPLESIVIAVAAPALPIVPSFFIRMSSLKVTIPLLAMVIASVALAEPTVPPSLTVRAEGPERLVAVNPPTLAVPLTSNLCGVVSLIPPIITLPPNALYFNITLEGTPKEIVPAIGAVLLIPKDVID